MRLRLLLLLCSSLLTALPACKTKSELRREQEFERLKEDVKEFKGSKADIEVSSEEIRADLARLTTSLNEQMQLQSRQIEDLKKELTAFAAKMPQLEQRILALEERASNEELAAHQASLEKSRGSYEQGKKFFDENRLDEAIETLRNAIKNRPHSEEAKKSQLLLADAYFASKDFASAALAFSDYRKNYSKDSSVPYAIYRQAQSFRSMGKNKEARLFYAELLERFPRNSLAPKAKQEMKRLKLP